MALGTTAAILLGLGAAGAAVGVSSMMGGPQKQQSSPIPLPQPPSREAGQTKAEDIVKRRTAAMSQSIYTSPLGIAGQADVNKKVLLGQ